MVLYNISWQACLLAALGNFIFGWLYYSPWCFGKVWARATGGSLGERPGFCRLAAAYVLNVLVAVGLWFAIQYTGAQTWPEVLLLTGAILLYFVFPLQTGRQVWEKNTWCYYAGNLFYQVLAFMLTASILFWVV